MEVVELPDIIVDNAEWHNVTLQHKGGVFILELDEEHRSMVTSGSNLHHFLDPYMTSLFVGGSLHAISSENEVIESKFITLSSCIRRIQRN